MKINLSFLICLGFSCLFASSCSEPANDNKKAAQYPAQYIEELKLQLQIVLEREHVPGMSAAIVHKDAQVIVFGLGKTNVANNSTATAKSLFRIGSTSKGFVSLAVLKLVEQGRLRLHDPIHQLVPEVWFENAWEQSDPIRVVHLLEHTTGFDDIHLREYALNNPTIGLLQALDFDHHSRISRWRPGTRMAYCNSGPAIAAYIVEKITKQPFEVYVYENFFKPLGMNTATYFQPSSEAPTTLYHSDGVTPYNYWNLSYRASGSINASAEDMAGFLRFYLNRGSVNGNEILPAAALSRMEIPKSTWAAKEGLKAGYGLSNYWTVHDGFVYHGHNGGVEGGLTDMAYMPDLNVGYFYSINAANPKAFEKIGTLIRAYLTRALKRPAIPPAAPLPPNAHEYSGWYEPDSPRTALTYFLERLFGMRYIFFDDGKLLMSSLVQRNATFLPVIDAQFRYVPTNEALEPIPTAMLLSPKSEGKFIQIDLGMTTIKRIATWLAIVEILITAFVLLSALSILLYAPFWILGMKIRKSHLKAERKVLLWPLIAALSLISIVIIPILARDDFISSFGKLSGWSFSLFFATIAFAVASALSVIALFLTPKEKVRPLVRAYSIIISSALVLAAGYLWYWGIIGLRTWA